MSLMILLSLLIFSVAFRLYMIRFSKSDFDAYGHMYMAKQLDKYRLGPFSTIPVNVVASKGFKYPFFFHWLIVNSIGIDRLIRFNRIINPLLDLLFVALYTFILWKSGFDLDTCIITGVLYLSCPYTFIASAAWPRLGNFTPRLFSEILSMMYFSLFFIDLEGFSWLKVSLIVLLGTVLVSSTKFGLQAILFLSILISIGLFSILPSVYMFGSVLTSLIISNGLMFDVLKAQLAHLRWYFFKNLQGGMSISDRSNLKQVWDRDVSIAKNIFRIVYTYSKSKGPLAGTLLIPYTLPFLVLALYYDFPNRALLVVVISGILLFFLVNLRVLLFLGESERYISHVLIILSLGLSLFIVKEHLYVLFITLMAYNFSHMIQEARVNKIRQRNLTLADTNDLIIKKLSQDTMTQRTIICFPYHLGSYYSILLLTPHKVFGVLLTDFESHPIIEEGLSLKYPFLDLNKLEYLHKKFGVDTIVYNEKSLSRAGIPHWKPPSNWQEVFASGTIRIMECQKS